MVRYIPVTFTLLICKVSCGESKSSGLFSFEGSPDFSAAIQHLRMGKGYNASVLEQAPGADDAAACKKVVATRVLCSRSLERKIFMRLDRT
jgi:hypothetical protein